MGKLGLPTAPHLPHPDQYGHRHFPTRTPSLPRPPRLEPCTLRSGVGASIQANGFMQPRKPVFIGRPDLLHKRSFSARPHAPETCQGKQHPVAPDKLPPRHAQPLSHPQPPSTRRTARASRRLPVNSFVGCPSPPAPSERLGSSRALSERVGTLRAKSVNRAAGALSERGQATVRRGPTVQPR